MSTIATAALTAVAYAALYTGHQLGDHPVQLHRDGQAKGIPADDRLAAGTHPWTGWTACIRHVATYTATQAAALLLVGLLLAAAQLALDARVGPPQRVLHVRGHRHAELRGQFLTTRPNLADAHVALGRHAGGRAATPTGNLRGHAKNRTTKNSVGGVVVLARRCQYLWYIKEP